MANYTTLPLLKQALGMGAADTSRDDLLNLALGAASRSVDNYTGRRFDLAATATARTYDTAGRLLDNGLLLVDDIGDTTGLVVETGYGSTWTTVTPADVTYSPVNAASIGWPYTGIVRAASWPGYPSFVRVTAKWGWPEVPDEVEQATLLQAARLFKRKDSPEGILGSSEWGALRVSRMDPDVASLLARYVVVAFA